MIRLQSFTSLSFSTEYISFILQKSIYDIEIFNLNDYCDSVKYNLGNAKYHSTYFDAKHCIIQGRFLRSIDFIKFSSETTLMINEKSI